jgi:hypothetical protein
MFGRKATKIRIRSLETRVKNQLRRQDIGKSVRNDKDTDS